MQTDPIGYSDGMNMYAYVGNDPLNGIDPSGLKKEKQETAEECKENNGGRDCINVVYRCGYSGSGGAPAYAPPRVQVTLRNGEGGSVPKPQNDGIDCSGYDLLVIADDVTGATNTLAGIGNDLLPKAAKLTPQGRALSIALSAIEGTAAAARIGAAYVRYDRYGDTLGLVNAVTQAFSGTAAAAAYGKVARLAGFKNTNISQTIVERIVPAGTDLGSSGPCATGGY